MGALTGRFGVLVVAGGRGWRFVLAGLAGLVCALAVVVLVAPFAAGAGDPPAPRLWDRCDADEPVGEQCLIPRGIATDPADGNVYVADQVGRRVVEFTAWGLFERAWGWDVVAGNAETEFEVCVPADGDVCKAGTTGSGAGQFGFPQGVAVDSEGSVYVVDRGLPSNQRVQKFSSDGEFELMFGGGVNQGGGVPANPGDVCTAAHLANGDVCGAGSQGSGDGEFGAWPVTGSWIAVGPGDEVYVGDEGRIQEFNTAGVYQGEIALAGELVGGLAVDPVGGDLYVVFARQADVALNPKPGVRRFSAAGVELGTVPVDRPSAVAVDGGGDLFVVDGRYSQGPPLSLVEVRRFSPSGELLSVFDEGVPRIPHVNPDGEGFNLSTGIATSQVTAAGDTALYVSNSDQSNSFVRSYNSGPDTARAGDPPLRDPDVGDTFARSVGVSDATVAAQVNPWFWADTSFYVEYGLEDCALGGCERLGGPDGIALGAGVVGSPQDAAVTLDGLEPDTTYHFRFVAESSGGGPTVGEGAVFTTFPRAPGLRVDCANQHLRGGASGRLSDCRAYELVSPPDKNGGDIIAPDKEPFVASPDGGRVAFASRIAFGDARSAPPLVNYLAGRDPVAGWSTGALDPPMARVIPGNHFPNMLVGFSGDLGLAWYATYSDPPPDPDGLPGYENLYRRDNASGVFTALTTDPPPQAPPGTSAAGHHFSPRVNGFAADGASAVFSANDRLTADASSATWDDGSGVEQSIRQLYEWREGQPLRLVSVLPDGGGANDMNSGAGGGLAFAEHAVSDDGERIYWTTGPVDAWLTHGTSNLFQGRVYVRVGGSETVAVSESVDGANAQFWAAAPDGSAALFSFTAGPHEGELYRFDLASESAELVATGVDGVAGASRDLTRGFVVSEDVLDGGPNSHGDSAVAGARNLYHYELGAGFAFVATGDAGDAQFLHGARNRHAQVSPDGRLIAFTSAGALTGYDNRDAVSGEPLTQAYRYSADSDGLVCVSCNPSGSRPARAADAGTLGGHGEDASTGWRGTLAFNRPRSLSVDGGRVFFESLDALLPADSNGERDVYEWRAPGVGDCSAASAYFFESSGGCLGLISSGKSRGGSRFGGASADGSTAFIWTGESLVGADRGQYDVYAVRVGGGFAEPAPAEPCVGDGCRPGGGRSLPLVAGVPASELVGAGAPAARARSCVRLARSVRRLRRGARRAAVRSRRLSRRARVVSRGGDRRRARRLSVRSRRLTRAARKRRRVARRRMVALRRCRAQARAGQAAGVRRAGSDREVGR